MRGRPITLRADVEKSDSKVRSSERKAMPNPGVADTKPVQNPVVTASSSKGAAPPVRIKDAAIVFKIIGDTTQPVQSRATSIDFVANWIEMKQKEYDALHLRPHPYKFAMYYDV